MLFGIQRLYGRITAHRDIKCSEESSIPDGELNEPSFSVTLRPPPTFNRTVTNAGVARSSYSVIVLALQGVDISVQPENFHKIETEGNIFGDIHPQ